MQKMNVNTRWKIIKDVKYAKSLDMKRKIAGLTEKRKKYIMKTRKI